MRFFKKKFVRPLNALKVILVLLLFVATFQTRGQHFTGNNTPTVGTSYVYTYAAEAIYPSHNWLVTNGTVTNTSVVGLSYRATIKFTSAGPATIIFRDGVAEIDELMVTAVCGTVAAPVATFTYANNCGNTVITRAGTPAASTTWYWQTTSTGTDVTQSLSTYTVLSSGTYYLRARNTTT